MPTGIPEMVTGATDTILNVVGSVANTIVTTFPLNLAVVTLFIGIGVGLYRKFKNR